MSYPKSRGSSVAELGITDFNHGEHRGHRDSQRAKVAIRPRSQYRHFLPRIIMANFTQTKQFKIVMMVIGGIIGGTFLGMLGGPIGFLIGAYLGIGVWHFIAKEFGPELRIGLQVTWVEFRNNIKWWCRDKIEVAIPNIIVGTCSLLVIGVVGTILRLGFYFLKSPITSICQLFRDEQTPMSDTEIKKLAFTLERIIKSGLAAKGIALGGNAVRKRDEFPFKVESGDIPFEPYYLQCNITKDNNSYRFFILLCSRGRPNDEQRVFVDCISSDLDCHVELSRNGDTIIYPDVMPDELIAKVSSACNGW